MVANICPQALIGLQRVYLPYLSKLRSDGRKLAKGVEYLLWASAALSAPLMMACFVLIHQLVRAVFGVKWEPAIPFFLLLAPAGILSQTTLPIGSMYYAVGKAYVNIIFALIMAIGIWIFAVPMTWQFGRYGFVVALLAIHLVDIGLIRHAQTRVSNFRLIRVVVGPWLASVVMLPAKWAATWVLSDDIGVVVLTIVLGLPAYIAFLLLIDRSRMSALLALILPNRNS
jgi:O-antigen/teichoic acid export membrane protein